MFPLGPRVRHSRQNRQVFHTTAITPACPACGHEVTFDPRIVGLTCPRCRTPLHRQPDDDTPIAATSVVPCVVTADQATRTVADALKDALAPGQSLPGVRLVFAPFWRFKAHVRASWDERTWDRVSEQHETTHGGVGSDYEEGILAVESGESHLLATIARLKPEDFSTAETFTPALLAGHEAMDATRPVADAWIVPRHADWTAR